MIDLRALPDLGVGFVYWPSLEGLLEAAEGLIDVVEVEPQPFWFPPKSSTAPYRLDDRAFDHLRRLPVPKLVHGVGCPVGGTVADSRHIGPFIDSINLLAAPWASEHLSFNRIPGSAADEDVGFLLPPLQSSAGIGIAAANIVALKSQLPVPFAFETGVSYLRPLCGELSDGAFFADVALEADCAILLDLHNVWANERNGRQRVLDLVDELPLERVLELHLAGGQDYDGYWVDAHSDLVPPALMDLARRVVPRLPNLKAIIYEVMPEYLQVNGISDTQLVEQFCALREIWAQRGTEIEPNPIRMSRGRRVGGSLPSPRAWEEALGTAVTTDRPVRRGLLGQLCADPGTKVVRGLIGAVRAGKVADTLTLTTRLLLLTVGDEGLDKLLKDFWNEIPSELMAADEAINFAHFIKNGPSADLVPYLRDIVELELAAHQAVISGRPQDLVCSVDPEPLLSALREGHLPVTPTPGNYEVTMPPPHSVNPQPAS